MEEQEPVQLDRDEIVQQLHNLDRVDLRQVAVEALLISDGPDKIEGDVTDCAVAVVVMSDGFRVYYIGAGDLRKGNAK